MYQFGRSEVRALNPAHPLRSFEGLEGGGWAPLEAVLALARPPLEPTFPIAPPRRGDGLAEVFFLRIQLKS